MLGRLLTGILLLPWYIARLCFRILGRLLKSRVGRVCLLLLGVYFAARSCGAPVLRVGTFNIQNFGPQTDFQRLIALLKETDADVLALQEIRDEDLLAQVAEGLSAVTARSYRTVVTKCGGKRALHLGFLYDSARVRLDKLQEFPELQQDSNGRCADGDRAGLLGTFSTGRLLWRTRTHLLTVHFPAGGDFQQAVVRQEFWARALRIVTQLQQSGESRVLLLGDMNSTGYLDDTYQERSAIHARVEQAGFRLLTPQVACTEYWQPSFRYTYVPSHLDHIAAPAELSALAAPVVHGFCATLQCQPTQQRPTDHSRVSDHCPVTVTLR